MNNTKRITTLMQELKFDENVLNSTLKKLKKMCPGTRNTRILHTSLCDYGDTEIPANKITY